jgi:hypothetical protein
MLTDNTFTVLHWLHFVARITNLMIHLKREAKWSWKQISILNCYSLLREHSQAQICVSNKMEQNVSVLYGIFGIEILITAVCRNY